MLSLPCRSVQRHSVSVVVLAISIHIASLCMVSALHGVNCCDVNCLDSVVDFCTWIQMNLLESLSMFKEL